MKSGWPGVSIRLTVTSSIGNDTTAGRIVMPRCCSSASESVRVVPLSTLPTSAITPAAWRSRSVRVVLPASTCARIPRFSVRRSKRQYLQEVGHSGLLIGTERCAHVASLVASIGAGQERIITGVPIFQPELETMPRPELERLQRERLRERFGVELEALPEQPFRVKSDLRDAYPFGLLQVPLEECVRIHASSGTRGKATIVAYTRADIAN